MFKTDFQIDYLWKCYPVGFTNHLQAKLLYFSWCVKGAEFIETVCFVLRKKDSQITFLHIYHHVSSFLFSYYAVRCVGSNYVFSVLCYSSRDLTFVCPNLLLLTENLFNNYWKIKVQNPILPQHINYSK